MRQCSCANKQKRQHFHAKTTSAKLYIYIGVGSRDLFIDEAHTVLGIFPVFFPCMLPTPLCGIFHQRLPSILGCLPPKLVSHQSPSCIKGRLPLKVVFPLNWYNLTSYLASFLLISSPVYSSPNREYYYEYAHICC